MGSRLFRSSGCRNALWSDVVPDVLQTSQVNSAALVQYTAPAVSFHASVLLVAELFAEEDRKALERVEAEHFSDWCHGRCNGGV